MENRIVVKFHNEDMELIIDYDEPDFTFFYPNCNTKSLKCFSREYQY